MLWTAPATGIAMWHVAVAVAMWPESANGYKQTLAGLKTTSALHPGADVPGGPPLKVKLTSVAESCLASIAIGTSGRVRCLRTDSWAGSGSRAPFCLWNQSMGPLARWTPPGGVTYRAVAQSRPAY